MSEKEFNSIREYSSEEEAIKVEELRKALNELLEDDLRAFELRAKVAMEFEKNFPNAREYALFHCFIGSTPEHSQELDMPGRPIEKMFRGFLDQFKKKE